MSDDPFRNQPEDFINRGLKATVSALPVVGGAIGEFVTFVIGDPAQERRDDFMRELYAGIKKLGADNEQAKEERLRENVQFQATFIQAAQSAARTVQDEKKAMLRNAVLNMAVGTIDENVRQIFMQFIERLTPLHVALLSFLNNPIANPAAKQRASNMMAGSLSDMVRVAIPELGNNMDFANILIADLEAAKLTNGAALNVTMSGDGLLASRTTELAKSFLRFISDPRTGMPPA